MSNQKYSSVQSVEILFGDKVVPCYLHADGETITFGYDWLASVANKDKTILSDKKSPYNIKTLTGNLETNLTVKVNGIGYSYASISSNLEYKIA